MPEIIQAIRGMNDILPEHTPQWQHIEAELRTLLEAYGFTEIRLPIVEKTALFERSIGETTDIVEKEMYTFADRNGDSLTLRPEGTAGCVRAVLEHGLLGTQASRKLWYAGPMFRHERPQKGRYRQFHQVGVEVFGLEGPDIDAELIAMTARLWKRLGLKGLQLQINSLGSSAARARYREALAAYFEAHESALDEDSRRRLHRNTLRILDSKNPDMQPLIAGAPSLKDYLDGESAAHFEALLGMLDALGVDYAVNPRLVRGLDYYGKTVFEWVTDRLGAQGTVCAGGRYDGLVEQFGGKPTPAIGFALGLERLVAMLGDAQAFVQPPHLYLIAAGANAAGQALVLAEELRDGLPGLRLLTHCGGGSFKAQFKRADRSGAALALVLGEAEIEQGTVSVKPLRGAGEQTTVARTELGTYLVRTLGLAQAGPPHC